MDACIALYRIAGGIQKRKEIKFIQHKRILGCSSTLKVCKEPRRPY